MLGPVLLAAARSDSIRRLVSAAPVTRPMVDRFVAGEQLDQCLSGITSLAGRGMEVTIDHLGEDITDRSEALRNRDAYLALAEALAGAGLGARAEMSVKLSAFGQALPGGHELATENVLPVVEAAAEAGTTVTLDMEDHTTVDSTLAILGELRQRFPATGAVVQSYLFRTEADCHALAGEGSRVRLVKGAYNEPPEVAFQDKREVDRAYVRCLKVLMAGKGYPMVGSHDPRMVAIAQDLAARYGRKEDEYEFQMLYGIRSAEQERLVAEGHRMRVYVPYGTDWYGYFMRRLAERPANLAFFLRSLVSRG
ncbi:MULTISPECIES: proline dehydrogenase family protein [unclassified Streptomyces]|uniref:proline dehydrogenase family protein n=1 Tax=unclassified Streptomyces TaxID=2593676 RepID=UPI002DD971FB|nr:MULTISPECIES: proline dehydrogenase family protein [unclassified Streptomyces]WSA92164.1 proline dehydrogenase family protein [Streptomyces sp. NBC_01795]WSB76529.1 proline dehydrogenase family protein [Streptomyces sp. NBC_01775]WSS15182.1 proline dehydrogenase family protein [Streptomyces sp. NBC_01186]WSS44024.1 proline dehydrogenase family protein [Streptomyces sp. NBC_01187]